MQMRGRSGRGPPSLEKESDGTMGLTTQSRDGDAVAHAVERGFLA
jgi:hypothetical protein